MCLSHRNGWGCNLTQWNELLWRSSDRVNVSHVPLRSGAAVDTWHTALTTELETNTSNTIPTTCNSVWWACTTKGEWKQWFYNFWDQLPLDTELEGMSCVFQLLVLSPVPWLGTLSLTRACSYKVFSEPRWSFTHDLSKDPAASLQQRWNPNPGFPELRSCDRMHITSDTWSISNLTLYRKHLPTLGVRL